MAASSNKSITVYKSMFKTYPDVVDIPALCEMLNISRHTAYRIIDEGRISCIKVGRAYRITKVDIIKFLVNQS